MKLLKTESKLKAKLPKHSWANHCRSLHCAMWGIQSGVSWCRHTMSVHLPLPVTREQAHGKTRQQQLIPDPECTLLTILIPAASHSAKKRSSVTWRPPPDEANRTTSSIKSRDEILRSLKWDPSATSVHNKCKQTQLGDQSIQSEVTGRSIDFCEVGW